MSFDGLLYRFEGFMDFGRDININEAKSGWYMSSIILGNEMFWYLSNDQADSIESCI